MATQPNPGTTTGQHWPVALADLPALLELLDDHAVPVAFSLRGGCSFLAFEAAAIRCRRCGQCLDVCGPEGRASIDLGRVRCARAIRRQCGEQPRLSLELEGRDDGTTFTLTGPVAGRHPGGEVWARLLEALGPAPVQP